MNVVYKHTPEVHTLRGAVAGFRYLSAYGLFQSLLDVGTGTGTWMSAAYLAGISDVWGIDVVECAGDNELIKPCKFEVRDLNQPLNLQRIFDCVICLEVAEHLEERSARTLIGSLCRHGNLIFFSAAQPGQFGQNHINCQWPSYWQNLFNEEGFACFDNVRWAMWNDRDIEPWYRQNMFRAIRDTNSAGSEPRILSVIHPDMVGFRSDCSSNGDTGKSARRLIDPIRAVLRNAIYGHQ